MGGRGRGTDEGVEACHQRKSDMVVDDDDWERRVSGMMICAARVG